MKASIVRAALVLSAGLTWVVACGSDSTTNGGSIPIPATDGFRGVLLSDDGSDGVFELHTTDGTRTQALHLLAGTPITLSGRVTLSGGLSAELTGTYDPDTRTLTASGTIRTGIGTITFDARYADGHLDGTWKGPGTLGGPLAGLGLSFGDVTLYCGPFDSARPGRVTVAVSGSLAGGAAAFTGAPPLLLGGSATATSIDLTFPNRGHATGTIDGATLNGSWSDATGTGSFTATTSACPVLDLPGPIEDAGADASDSGGKNPPADAGDAGNPPADAGDAGHTDAGAAANLLQEAEPINDLVVAGDYVGYTFGFSKALSFVKKDGTGKDKTDDVCASQCTTPVAQGSSIVFLDGTNVKKVTPPSKTVTTLGTVPEAMLYGKADDRYIWFSSVTKASGGFYRFDTQQSSSSNNLGRPLNGFDLVAGILYYTDGAEVSDYAFKKFEGTFTSEPSALVARANIPDTIYGAVASEAAGSVFLTTQQPSSAVSLRWVDHTLGGAATIATLDRDAPGSKGLVSVGRVVMDSTNVFVIEGAAGGQNGSGRVLYVAKTTRNGTSATELVAFPSSKVRAFALDPNAVYIGLQDGTLVRQPKP